MKKKILIVLFLVWCLLIASCSLSFIKYKELKNRNIRLQKEIIKNEQKVNNTKQKVDTSKNDYEKLLKQKESIINRYKIWQEKNKEILKLIQ